jgi:hypothetical protein
MSVVELVPLLKAWVASTGERAEDLLARTTSTYRPIATQPTRAANGDGLFSMLPLLSILFTIAPSGSVCQVPLKTAISRLLVGTAQGVDLLATEIAAATRCGMAHVRRIKANQSKWTQAPSCPPK